MQGRPPRRGAMRGGRGSRSDGSVRRALAPGARGARVLMLPPAVRIYVARDGVDMRKSFDGLAALTQFALGEDPLSGHLYVFRNRPATLVKILYRDRSGWCLFAKRLE